MERRENGTCATSKGITMTKASALRSAVPKRHSCYFLFSEATDDHKNIGECVVKLLIDGDLGPSRTASVTSIDAGVSC